MLGIGDDVKVKVRRYKTKAASSNIKTRTIYINEDLIKPEPPSLNWG